MKKPSEEEFKPFSKEAIEAADAYGKRADDEAAQREADIKLSMNDGSPRAKLLTLAAEARNKRPRRSGVPRRNYSESNGSRLSPKCATLGVIAAGLGINLSLGLTADAGYGSDEAEEYLSQQGYDEMDLTSKNLMFVNLTGCGSNDTVQYNFNAIAANGDPVNVMVCKGILKAATIRQS